MFCARRDGRRVSYGFRDNGVDRVDPILRARHRFSGARSAQALADLNRATRSRSQSYACGLVARDRHVHIKPYTVCEV